MTILSITKKCDNCNGYGYHYYESDTCDECGGRGEISERLESSSSKVKGEVQNFIF